MCSGDTHPSPTEENHFLKYLGAYDILLDHSVISCIWLVKLLQQEGSFPFISLSDAMGMFYH